MSDSARKFMACCVAWRVRGARARAWLVGGRWHGGGRERTGGCVERVTPQHPVRRRCASLKPVHQVPTAHAAKALAVAAVEDDRVARLHGQTQWRRRLWRRLARAPEALAGRPVHWRGAVKSVESRPDPQGARYAVEAQQQEWSPSRGGGVASTWPSALLQATPSRATYTYGYRLRAPPARSRAPPGACPPCCSSRGRPPLRPP